MKIPCVRDCKNRSVDCHCTCEKYKEYKEEIEKANKKKRLDRQINKYFMQTYYSQK